MVTAFATEAGNFDFYLCHEEAYSQDYLTFQVATDQVWFNSGEDEYMTPAQTANYLLEMLIDIDSQDF